MGGDGFEDFKQSSHYSVGCTGCHNGIDNTDDKNLAHSGTFINHPSSIADIKCAPCHAQLVQNFSSSIHNGTGQKSKVALRSGLSGANDFDQLEAHKIEGYNHNCSVCHGTCGNCHVVRPEVGGKGLLNGHSFNKTPDMLNTCITCHSSRVGHAFLGVTSGTKPDVHLTQEGFKCLNCHTGNELHGNGQPVEQRYAYTELPECLDCHSGIENINSYHFQHFSTFNCQVCHSQIYNNCGSCHIGHEEGARIPAYMDFKIAGNAIPSIKPYNLTLVRRTLAAPDNWEVFGVSDYASFDVFPTYNYASPHNILRWTDRTQVGTKSCFSNCHIRNEGGTLVNKEIYLFEEDLLPWEINANTNIVVDTKLPASWFIE